MTLHITYVTVDSISEGVGSSQILPLLLRLSDSNIQIHLISFEKYTVRSQLVDMLTEKDIRWTRLAFGSKGISSAIRRLFRLSSAIGDTDIIHARSDIPALAGLLSRRAPVLWDVRSLWASQRFFIEPSVFKKILFLIVKPLEGICSTFSCGLSSLTNAVIPVLESRHKRLPKIRSVVPTTVDLNRFKPYEAPPTTIRGLYSGTYNNYYDLCKSREFIIALRKFNPVEIHWARPFESEKRELQGGETHVFEATQAEMAHIIPQFSFGISICKQIAGLSLKAAMPTKIAEFLASGRPVVLSKGIGDMDEFFAEFRAGVIVDTEIDNLDDKAQELLELLADPATPLRCRAMAEKYFDIDNGVSKYIEMYKRILNC